MVEVTEQLNPFPGLRPFEFGEEYLFFGREGQADELLLKLQQHRFVAIIGPSGSGKSSLVQAGLLPAIYSGFLQGAGSHWRVAVMRPGVSPIRNLALELNQPEVLGKEEESEEDANLQALFVESTLQQGCLGLVEVVRQARLEPHENLLLVVDQFEELFRFQRGRGKAGELAGDEAAAFVKLLLGAVQQRQQPIYVVLTMRSDFLGDCTQFVGLPEAINDSQYLIPRMTRDQLRLAIEGPIGVVVETIAPSLVQRLLNDVRDDLDRLPVLQHALMRTWDYWQGHREGDEPVDLRHYEAIGTMSAALSNHADDIYEHKLTARQQEIAKQMFQRLTELGQDGREIRRPTSLSEIARVVDVTEEEVRRVVDRFRGANNSFLMPPVPEPLTNETMVDISHESLMRIWGRLKEWVQEEKTSAREYLRLTDKAARYRAGGAGLLQEPELSLALNWRREQQPTVVWASRYADGFNDTIEFLQESVEARDRKLAERERAQEEKERLRKQQVKRARSIALGMTLLAAVAIWAAVFGWLAKRQANRDRDLAERARLNATLLAQSLKTDNLLVSHLELESLVTAIRLGKRLEQEKGVDGDVRWRGVASLSEAVYSGRERNRLEGHSGPIRSVSFSPDGQTLASASPDNTIELWTVEGEELQTLEGHRGSVLSVSFSPDGETVASASSDGTVKLWNFEGEELQTLQGHRGTVYSANFSPDGQSVASASEDGTVKLWNFEGEELLTLQGHLGTVYSANFSPDGQTVASASEDGTVKLWNFEGEELQTLQGHLGTVYSANFSPDGQTMVSASEDGTIKLWNLEGEELQTLQGHREAVWSVSVSPDGETVASASSDGTVKLWNLEGEELQTLQGHREAVWSVNVSPDGETVASASSDGTVKLWNLEGEELQTLQGHLGTVYSANFSPDGQTVASASEDGTIKLWNLEGEELQILQGHREAVWSVSVSPDGQTVASASEDGTVKLWNLEGEELQTLQGHREAVWSANFSPDGQTVASASEDGTVKLWNFEGEELQTLQGHREAVWSASFSPDGQTVASASEDGTVKLWNFEGEELQTLQGHLGTVYSANFSPDGQTVVSASEDGTIKLWNLEGEELQTLQGHRGTVYSVSVSPDGQTVASASEDGTVKLWNFRLDDLLARGCRQITDYLRHNPNVREEDRQLCNFRPISDNPTPLPATPTAPSSPPLNPDESGSSGPPEAIQPESPSAPEQGPQLETEPEDEPVSEVEPELEIEPEIPEVAPETAPPSIRGQVIWPDGLLTFDAPAGNRKGGIAFNEIVTILEWNADRSWQRIRRESGEDGWVKSGNIVEIE